ncbi:MAG: hypothetical protein V4484_03345 [Pseudomonadota bacterium]
MQHSLVAVFDNRGDAQKALEQLVAAGYTREQARLSEGDPTGDTSLEPVSADHTFMSGIRHFFTDIFGTERREDARIYADAVKGGHHVLTVSTDTLAEVERAADLVERFGPVDIDEHAQLSGARPAPASSARQHAQPMSQQRDASTEVPITHVPARGNAPQGARSGMRIYQHMVEDVEWLAPADEADFRTHWGSNYANEGGAYEDYAPAYTYGGSMARSDLYRGRQWDDVESHLRGDWEARHPHSAWDKFKAAVKHGWERITT